ncbi:MAG TPA: DUF2309 domain-containing protein [Chryseolinea sp.]|nr:DUF2309 domain-containing protein [Chryseolinea sp.]
MNLTHSSHNEPSPELGTKGPFYFNEEEALHDLKHFLPAQAPLKDFIHHNTLHAFQHLKFFKALQLASEIFGYRVSLSLDEYRSLFKKGKINENILDRIITQRHGTDQVKEWKEKLLSNEYQNTTLPRIGALRSNWKRYYHIDLDSLVHPTLFRVICSYLDQGISIWNFPVGHQGFLAAIRELERNSFTSFFKTERVRSILLEGVHAIGTLLNILIGDKSLYKQYLFDQQFAHQGWSGIVASVEDNPQYLLDPKKISLHDIIYFELLLEIDALDFTFGEIWSPLAFKITTRPVDLFSPVTNTELDEVSSIWQEALEWSYYDQVLSGMKEQQPEQPTEHASKSFQAMFCIDDREFSLRHYLEKFDDNCETFGTPGFFSVEFFFKPENGKFYTKLCPAPVTPKYLIQEVGSTGKRKKDVHFTKHSHTLFSGWLISQTMGFFAAFRLFLNIFKPTLGPATAHSFDHMDKIAGLTIENKNPDDKENGLQIGFTIDEMAVRVESLLKSIGLVKDFAPLVYVIGHGSSSVNNPHYAAYDCGACSGRPGSVNARAFCFMANHAKVRAILANKGINIPEQTQFVGGLHDTTRDEIVFFDEPTAAPGLLESHHKNQEIFRQALDANSKERSRRFESINTALSPAKIHPKVKNRSVSLFEPRPELNHATNSLCIVGRRSLTKNLFLDRRAFLNSYDYSIDMDGKLLFNILKPLGPVCGGINLEYFFSRVDNQKLGAGTKLPHNVMGLFGVANGIEGDLRPGLPSQMIEVHDPVRLMLIVEHFPDVVLETIQRSPEVYEWYINEWVHLIAVDPTTKKLFSFTGGAFADYKPLQHVDFVDDVTSLVEATHDNIPVHIIS